MFFLVPFITSAASALAGAATTAATTAAALGSSAVTAASSLGAGAMTAASNLGAGAMTAASNLGSGAMTAASNLVSGAGSTITKTVAQASKSIPKGPIRFGKGILKDAGKIAKEAADASEKIAKVVTGEPTTKGVAKTSSEIGKYTEKFAQKLGMKKNTAKQLGKLVKNSSKTYGNTSNIKQVYNNIVGNGSDNSVPYQEENESPYTVKSSEKNSKVSQAKDPTNVNGGSWVNKEISASRSKVLTRENLNIIFLIDNSYSMLENGALTQLNFAIPELMHILDSVADENGVNVKVRIISFSDKAKWIVGTPENGVDACSVAWQGISADNNTATSLAIREANKALKKQYLGAHALRPVVLLITDGKCNPQQLSSYHKEIEEMKTKLSGSTGKEKVTRIAIGVNDFDFNELAEFATVAKYHDQDQPLVFTLENMNELIPLISMTVLSSMYSSISADSDDNTIEIVEEYI